MSQNKKKYHGWKWHCVKSSDRLIWIYCTVAPGAWGNPSARTLIRRECVTYLRVKYEDPRDLISRTVMQMQNDMQCGIELPDYGVWIA